MCLRGCERSFSVSTNRNGAPFGPKVDAVVLGTRRVHVFPKSATTAAYSLINNCFRHAKRNAANNTLEYSSKPCYDGVLR